MNALAFRNLEEVRLNQKRLDEPRGYEILEYDKKDGRMILLSRTDNDKFEATYEWFKYYVKQRNFWKQANRLLMPKPKLTQMYS